MDVMTYGEQRKYRDFIRTGPGYRQPGLRPRQQKTKGSILILSPCTVVTHLHIGDMKTENLGYKEELL
ncbi:hypothetical protein L1887_19111 [Cichorium endivia]|nr:hypothetical protein L1887_19111 [Cichorium endivia]